MSKEKQIEDMYGDLRPYCEICDTDCVLASDEDLRMYKTQDKGYNLDFMFIPDCDCWENNEEWMAVKK